MFTTLERNEATVIRDRSSFIGILLHATSKESVEQYLKDVRKEYPKAKHYCYAYIIGNDKKCSDDGEPAKTAGRPLMELLEKKEMDEVLLIVVRYFGGTLLGASRLMSTYIEAGVAVISGADIYSIAEKYVYHVEMNYSDFDHLKYFAKKEMLSLENIVYETKINADIILDEEKIPSLINEFPNASIDVYGKKKIYERS